LSAIVKACKVLPDMRDPRVNAGLFPGKGSFCKIAQDVVRARGS